jgi:hypothetical protein
MNEYKISDFEYFLTLDFLPEAMITKIQHCITIMVSEDEPPIKHFSKVYQDVLKISLEHAKKTNTIAAELVQTLYTRIAELCDLHAKVDKNLLMAAESRFTGSQVPKIFYKKNRFDKVIPTKLAVEKGYFVSTLTSTPWAKTYVTPKGYKNILVNGIHVMLESMSPKEREDMSPKLKNELAYLNIDFS